MGLIAVMSLAGSIVMVIYYLARGIFRDRWNMQGRERMLKLAMFFFLCPIQKIKYYFPEWVVKALPGMYQLKGADFYDWSVYTILPAGSGEYLVIRRWKVVLICVGFIAALAFVIYQMNRYYHLKKELSKCSVDMTEALSHRLAERFKVRTFYKKRVRIRKSSAVKTPFVIGILRPMIYLPESDTAQNELEIICCHELVHIKKGDVLVKCICLLVILIHWFNPFAYLLLIEFSKVSECRCDVEVLKKIEEDERSTYAKLIVGSAVCEEKRNRLWTTGFGGGRKDIYNRVKMIMDRKGKKLRNYTVILIMALLCGSATTYAYEMTLFSDENLKNGEKYGTGDWMIVTYGENDLDSLDNVDVEKWFGNEIESELDFSCFDCVFIVDSGEVFYYTEGNQTMYEKCTHTFVSGKIYKHDIDGKGGCMVSTYEGKLCPKCKLPVQEKLISTFTYSPCPH